MALAAIVLAVATWRVMGAVLLNQALVTITVGGILVLLGLAGTALLSAVDACGDAAAVFGAAVDHDRTRNAAILEQAAGIRAVHAKAGADEARAAGPPMALFGAPVMAGDGHGRYEDEEWAG